MDFIAEELKEISPGCYQPNGMIVENENVRKAIYNIRDHGSSFKNYFLDEVSEYIINIDWSEFKKGKENELSDKDYIEFINMWLSFKFSENEKT
jgi:hypothetical protein